MNISVSLANVLASLTTMASAFPKHGSLFKQKWVDEES